MKKPIILFSLFLFLSIQFAFAQIQITGTVTSDNDGMTLPGASVVIKGSTTGTVTNFEGKYTISASEGEVLIFSYIGMLSQEAIVGKTPSINIVLEADIADIDEVMVVAYGTTTKASFTGSAKVLKSEDIGNQPVSSFDKALEGRVAGLQVANSTGQPGAPTKIRIRGKGSFSASSSPLYVIDGVPSVSDNLGSTGYETNIMATINPGDIESITVLKDAAAASLYGSRAANGVIIITTKKGEKGKAINPTDIER